nr:hydroxyethylthiazole kinase [Salmonella sp. NCTC 7297]
MQPDLHCRTLAAHTLKHFRARSPLTHCMTNDVVQTFTANTLLALGASPAMVIDPVEARPFAAIANALLVNVGTLTASRADAMCAAVESAYDAKTPWTLDPVAVGALEFRRRFCLDLLSLRPAAIRGNASEILALAGMALGGPRRRYHRGGVGRTACGAGAGASDRLHRCGHRRGRLRH